VHSRTEEAAPVFGRKEAAVGVEGGALGGRDSGVRLARARVSGLDGRE
jgi:hypothetical protein